VNKADVDRHNDRYERYYNELGLIPKDDREEFWEAMRRDLPNSFRFTGSKAHALAVQQRLRDFYIPEITSITYEGKYVDAPLPVPWYPDQLAWYMTTPKNVIRRFAPFASFQKFLVAETDVGNITRQEVVSMIPPLLMDLKPYMTVLDLCAAPGSKSGQLIEMLHAGEEDRAREVAYNLANGLDRPEGVEYEDDGRSTGLLIANDVDYKRAHMLVHQMKRLNSPNIIVTNHDATIYPSIKLPSASDGPNKYLKFDRILADVPCSGDGTTRKNLEIWRKWIPSDGLGLHVTQVKILIRALQMLKVGGRVVYSTCSMNPVEDEAVLAAAIESCGGSDLIEILETKNYLPGLKRYNGLKEWQIMDKAGRMWSNYQDVVDHKANHGDEGLTRLQESMFPPKTELALDRAIRVYPHQQNTGAFFIAILEKKSEIKARPLDKPIAVKAKTGSIIAKTEDAADEKMNTDPDGTAADVEPIANGHSSPKRKREGDEENPEDTKRVKKEDHAASEVAPQPSVPNGQPDPAPKTIAPISIHIPGQDTTPRPDNFKRKNRDTPFEEPFKFLNAEIPELAQIAKFYNISDRFPKDRFLVRNAQSTASKNVYYTTALAKDILQENEGKGMKFVHSGIKMFVKQDVPNPDICPWRIQTDGLSILEAWVGRERVVTLTKKDTLRKLLKEMFPKFDASNWKELGEIGEQVREIGMGCCVLVVEPSNDPDGLNERMVFPLWKSVQSLNLMLPKEERSAMLLRLFNDSSPLLNQNMKPNPNQIKKGDRKPDPQSVLRRNSSSPSRTKRENTSPDPLQERRNSSSPEPQAAGDAGSEDEDGGVKLE
jgi:multisite-specific tRNA:(cytosine-C5)-methyltransferase